MPDESNLPTGVDASTADLTEQVVASFDLAPDRMRSLMQGLVRHLHAFVSEQDLTDDEWRSAIDFMTRAGQLTSDVRQELILLSDVLGISSLVDLLTNSRTPESTPSAVLGPFYVEGPPEAVHGSDISGGVDGVPVLAEITVEDPRGQQIPSAVIDVWQANTDGWYDVQLPDLDGPVLRARFRTDEAGRLAFWTILPAPYPIPADGPVGALLEATARHPMRAPHVHFMIAAPGRRRLVTQLFVAGGDHLDSDTVFGVKQGLIVGFPLQDDPAPAGAPVAAVPGGWRRLTFTFRLASL